MARINNIIKNKANKKNSIDILVLKEKLSLTFNEDVDLVSQKERIMQKLETINKSAALFKAAEMSYNS